MNDDQLENLPPSERHSDLFDAGQMIGRYRVMELLDRSGMGAVYRAVDTQLDRQVTLQLLDSGLAAQPDVRKRFISAARTAAEIQDGHVVAVYSVEVYQGQSFLVKEFVPGQTLDALLAASKKLIATEVARLGLQIAQGLQAAHQRGVMHGDLKPGNVLLQKGADGLWHAKITDFGMAGLHQESRFLSDRSGGSSAALQSESAERGAGVCGEVRDDLFLFGCLLYTLSTGEPPFKDSEGVAALQRVVDESPRPIEQLNPNLSLPLIAIIERLMAKDSEARFASAAEVVERLSKLTSSKNLVAFAEYDSRMTSEIEPWYQKTRQLLLAFGILLLVLTVPLVLSKFYTNKKPKKPAGGKPEMVVSPTR